MKNKYYLVLIALLLPLIAWAASEQTTPYDKVTQGKSTVSNKDYVFNIGAGSANPRIRGNSSTNKMQFAHDGVTFFDLGAVTSTVGVSSGGTGQTSYTDGQLLIGNSTGNTLAKSTLTAGAGVTITNGAGSITIAASGGGTFISSTLNPGTRVTGSAPTTLGEYRSYLRNASGRTFTETNGAPAIAPSASNGIALYTGNAWGSNDTANSPTTYDIFVGTNKIVTPLFYSSTGKTGFISVDMFPFSSYDVGYAHHYDKTTGIFRITRPTILGAGASSGHIGGIQENGDSYGGSVLYFDLFIQNE